MKSAHRPIAPILEQNGSKGSGRRADARHDFLKELCERDWKAVSPAAVCEARRATMHVQTVPIIPKLEYTASHHPFSVRDTRSPYRRGVAVPSFCLRERDPDSAGSLLPPHRHRVFQQRRTWDQARVHRSSEPRQASRRCAARAPRARLLSSCSSASRTLPAGLARRFAGTRPGDLLRRRGDSDGLHRRLTAIAEHYGVKFRPDRRGLAPVVLRRRRCGVARPDRQGKVRPTPLFERLLEAAVDIRPRHIGSAVLPASSCRSRGSRTSRLPICCGCRRITKVGGSAVFRSASTAAKRPASSGAWARKLACWTCC
jgi:hypothetical protein